jgi:aspartate/tyrosine/aromatic aminotransferase
MICKNTKLTETITSQMNIIVRGLYSSPPLQGARIVSRILGDKDLYSLFEEDLKKMSDRIIFMRKKLFDALVEKKTPGDWNHIMNQIGMFSFTGLSEKQVERMVNHFHIYMIGNGRISMAGLNESNVDYVASAIHDCVTTIQQ